MNEQLTNAPRKPHAAADSTNARAARPATTFDQVRQFLPSFLVLVLLVGVGWWGFTYEWNLKKFQERVFGKKVEESDRCGPHDLPEDLCVLCNPHRWPADPDFGWCKDHGVYNCAFDHPELAQLGETPTVTDAERTRVRRALDLMPRPKNEDADPAKEKDRAALKRIQLASDETAEKIGLEFKPAKRATVEESVSAPGEISYDPTRVGRLAARAPGTVWRVLRQVGDPVKKGEVLVLVDAAEVGKAKTEFLQAFANHELKADLLRRYRNGKEFVPEATLQQAETAEQEAANRLQSAEQALVNLDLHVTPAELKKLKPEQRREFLHVLGLPPALVKELGDQPRTANLIPLRSPLDGVVVARAVANGDGIDTTRTAMTVADVSHVWLTLEVRLEDAKYVKLCQEVRFRADGRDDDVTGKIDWVSTRVDAKTRTLSVRVPLANDDGTLRDGAYGLGRVLLRRDDQAVVVPGEALHWTGESHVVFVKDRNFDVKGQPKVFHVRSVRPGARTEKGEVELIVGVFPGEVVATTNSGVLRGELLKGKIGAGEAD
jgi:cobalt-zinc-cadmium efflux system membrane fusion protein